MTFEYLQFSPQGINILLTVTVDKCIRCFLYFVTTLILEAMSLEFG